jgi:hypothetical protein
MTQSVLKARSGDSDAHLVNAFRVAGQRRRSVRQQMTEAGKHGLPEDFHGNGLPRQCKGGTFLQADGAPMSGLRDGTIWRRP